jgi:hypothetical protein
MVCKLFVLRIVLFSHRYTIDLAQYISKGTHQKELTFVFFKDILILYDDESI